MQALRRMVLATCVSVLSATAFGAEDVPANTWVTAVAPHQGGGVQGIYYVPAIDGMLLGFGRVFKPATRAWVNVEAGRDVGPLGTNLGRHSYFTEWRKTKEGFAYPALPGHNRGYWPAHQACYLPDQKRMLYFYGGVTFTYDPKAIRFENTGLSFGGAPPDVMLGSMAWDPVNKEAVLFGGGYLRAYQARPGDRKQTRPKDAWTPDRWDRRGTWAYSPSANVWRKIETASKAVYAANADLGAFTDRLRGLWGTCRAAAFEYVKAIEGTPAAETAKRAETLAAEFDAYAGKHAEAGSDDYERWQFSTAAGQVRERIVANLRAAAESLKADDGWNALQAVEKAWWGLLEAQETLATAPRPRDYARLVYDPTVRQMVLWGGFAEDRFLADTWLYDCATHRWERVRAKVHPSLSRSGMVAMDYDARNEVVVLTQQNGLVWAFDTSERAWTRLDIPAPKFSLGRWPPTSWMSMDYDPKRDLHVVAVNAINPGNSRSNKTKTMLLRLDRTTAKVAEVTPGAPEEVWQSDKYQQAWRHLPKTQAEYRQRVAEHRKRIDAMPANQWVEFKTPYGPIGRAYGSFCTDWDRDEIHLWGGGHSAYMGNEWSQYDMAGNVWMESWNPEFPPWPYGNPDGPGWSPSLTFEKGTGHGYHYYVYWGAIRKTVLHTSVYDPDRMRYADQRLRQQGKGSRGIMVEMNGDPRLFTVSARYYRGAPFGVWQADPKGLTLERIKGSDSPFSGSDRIKAVFDTKRNRVLFYGAASAKKAGKKQYDGFWAFDLAEKKWSQITPTVLPEGADAPDIRSWNYCYSATHDCLMVLAGGTWVYDFKSNTFRKVAEKGSGPGVVYSPDFDLFYTLHGGGYKAQKVMAFRYAEKGVGSRFPKQPRARHAARLDKKRDPTPFSEGG